MRLTRSVITENAMRKPSSLAAMGSVFPSCGSVIMRTIAGMTVTNLPTAADTETAQKDGEDVRATQTTDASLNGYSAMARMTVEMELTNCLKIAPNVRKRATSSVETKGVYPKGGCVILKTIAATTLMKMMKRVRADTENALNQNSAVATTSVFLQDGDVIMMTTAVMAVMNQTA